MKILELKNLKVFVKYLLIFVILSASINYVSGQQNYKIGCIAFYNVENLFDTINDPKTRDEEFTPTGANAWTWDKYQKKLNNMSEAISRIGEEHINGGPHILGLAEIENLGVIQDLINMPKLKNSKYQIVHYDSPDRRGVDVGLIYRSDYFKVTNTRAVRFTLPKINLIDEENPVESKDDDFFTRDILMVSGIFDGDELHVLVNHWPSRRGGEKASEPYRIAAAKLCRKTADSILTINPKAKIVIMGDLNDNPDNISVNEYLKAKKDIKKLKDDEFFNTLYKSYKKGIGSNAYRDTWSLFDQIIISQGFINADSKVGYKFWKASVFNAKFLITKSGKYEGYPFRTFDFNNFQNGFSDHFPSLMYIIKEK